MRDAVPTEVASLAHGTQIIIIRVHHCFTEIYVLGGIFLYTTSVCCRTSARCFSETDPEVCCIKK